MMHGLSQSEDLTRAAQVLSQKRAEQREHARVVAEAPVDQKSLHVERAATLAHEVGVAKAVYRAAYKAYTNPFGIEKTFS